MLPHAVASSPSTAPINPSVGKQSFSARGALDHAQPLSEQSIQNRQRQLLLLSMVANMRGALGKRQALISGLSVGMASAVSAGLTYPVGAALNQAMTENLRGIRWQDATLKGVELNMLRVLIKYSLLDTTNAFILRSLAAISQQARAPGLDQARAGAASALTALLVSVLLCPTERIQRFQMLHNEGLISSMRRMMQEGGVRTFFTGSLSAFINTLPAVLIRSFAESMCQGDKAREKAMMNRLTLILSPLRTYLAMVKQVQQTYGTPMPEAFGIIGRQALEKPPFFLLHMIASMLFAGVANQVYFEAKDQIDGVILRVSGVKEGDSQAAEKREEIQGKKEKNA